MDYIVRGIHSARSIVERRSIVGLIVIVMLTWSGSVWGKTTFTKDVAPIVFAQCAECHRPNASAPFSLLTYRDVEKRAKQIIDVTKSGFMPPWLPDPKAVSYKHERRLTGQQLQTLQDWVKQGTPEGDTGDLPPLPTWATGWQLGPPDLILQAEAPLEVAASGSDIYRNFVIPIPIDRPRWTYALELRPGNPRIVHHAFTLVDTSGTARKMDRLDQAPGFPGMNVYEAASPDGHFVGWQPGRRPYVAPEGTAWRLLPGSDLVVQMHIQCTGKIEQIQPTVGLYFTDTPPTRFPVKLALGSLEIDIPAGESNYAFERSFTLPVAAELLAITPHAHYLAKKMESYAILPNGTKKWLLKIDDWDLNWQGDYQFAEQLVLPAQTKIVQKFTYDNSADNPRNPHTPTVRVRYGPEATDEMGSIWLQLMPASQQDGALIKAAYARDMRRETIDRCQKGMRETPNDPKPYLDLGKIALASQRFPEADALFVRGLEADPNHPMLHYFLGNLRLRQGRADLAEAELRQALKLEPTLFRAHNDLGIMHMQAEKWNAAEDELRQALQDNPYEPVANLNLAIVLARQGKLAESLDRAQRVLLVEDDNPSALQLVEKIKAAQSKSVSPLP